MAPYEIIIIGIIIFLCLSFTMSSIGILIGGSFGAPFVPTGKNTVDRMITAAKIKKGDTVWDIGCGDGRLLIAAVKAGAKKAIGVEISLPIYVLAKLRVWWSGYGKQIEVRFGNVFAEKWHDEFKHADIVFAFLLPKVIDRVISDIWPHLPKKAKLISHAFQTSDKSFTPDETIMGDGKTGRVHVFMK